MMRAHSMGLKTPSVVRNEEGKESQEDEVAIGGLGPLPPVGKTLYRSASLYNPSEVDQSPAILSSSKPSTRSGTPSFDQSQQELQRAQSLSACVSSIINQARALEHIKLASTGKVKGGSSLKGSPAWKAQRKLCSSVESTAGASSIPTPTLRLTNDANGSGSSPKRTSWVGSGLMGIGLTIIHSYSTNVITSASTPSMRVRFAKEPVRYSEERESEALDEDDEEGDGAESSIDDKGMDGEVDGGHTIKPQSSRRTKSWNGSVKGVGSRQAPSKRWSKGGESGKEKKQRWLEGFLAASTGTGGVPGTRVLLVA
jgi:hypothetical protein